jgi:acyl-coenzyme A thioesterase PaaI-like protein
MLRALRHANALSHPTHFLRPAANDDFLIEATVKRFGKTSAYIDCSVTFVGSGELVAHAVLEFAF